MDNIIVFGGAGFIGTRLVARLSAAGHRVCVPTRRRERARHLLPLPTVEVVEVDTFDGATLERLLHGRDAVANLVGVLHGRRARPYGPEFARAHQRLPQNLAQACASVGVPRLVHVSALGADSAGCSMYLRSKGDGEAALRAQAGLRWTIMRPSVVFGPGDRFLHLFAALQRVMPVVLLGGARQRFAPVYVDDVACALQHALVGPRAEATVGRVYELGGPRSYALAELVRLAGAWAGVAHGRGRPVLALPDAPARVLAALLEHAPGGPLMSRDNLDSMRVPSVPTGALPGIDAPELGVGQAHSIEAVAADDLGRRGAQARFDAWRMIAGR